MSFEISPKINDRVNVDTSIDHSQTQEEWVEIVEPKSKTKIYANLQSGICAKFPPKQSSVVKTDDFWWELFDKKTGKYYYYNPEQQKTSWAKPTSNGDGKRLLIIPVSKLKTFRKLSTGEQQSEKCDASTQTIAHSLISTGTQTISELDLENELSNKLRLVDIPSDLSKSNSCTHSQSVKKSLSPRSRMNHRQYSDFTGKPQNPYLRNYQKQVSISNDRPHGNAHDQLDHYQKSSHHDRILNEKSNFDDQDEMEHSSKLDSYFGPSSTYHANRKSMHIQEPVSSFVGSLRRDEVKLSTSTFKNAPRSNNRSTHAMPHHQQHQQDRNPAEVNGGNTSSRPNSNTQQMVTNNLSQYLVREARAMGIALISDDEIEDDDHDTDDECNVDDDEDTDLRDDLSSHQEGLSDLNASQDLGEDSSEGWKSFSDQDSPNGPKNQHHPSSTLHSQQSTNLREAPPSSLKFNEMLDDQRDPAACISQQLDHRKLVANFKKSRQTSALGFNDSLGRSYKLDANQAVHRLKTVADSYFNTNDRDKSSDSRNLRQFSAISTLPRPNKDTKDRSSSVMQENLGGEIDADYDVVEENCGYYSDSERLPTVGMPSKGLDATKCSMLSTPANKAINESSSPVSYFDRNKSTRGSTFSVESFARENLTRHPKGGLLFNRKVKWSRMISWTKNSIKQPMISSVSSELNSDSIAAFKLIQQFMGDRKVTISKKYRQILTQAGVSEESYGSRKSLGRSNSLNVSRNSSSGGGGSSSTSQQIPNRLRDELAYELCVKGCVKSSLRDEIFVQLARQLTENPCQESTSWGLILMSILLSYFSPSSKFAPFLLAFLETHPHVMARDVCLPRLEKRLHQNWFSYCRKPADGEEIAIVRLSITKWPQYCGIFGESLERIMDLQTCSPFLKTLRLPWILTTLGEKLIETGGSETEGLFRCAADHDLLAQIRLEIDCVDFRKITDAKQMKSLLSNVQDPHVIAGLLKLFFRQLKEPVFPSSIYEACLQSCQDVQMARRIFEEHLPNLNKDVVAYLIRLLQSLAESDKVTLTKMDTSNLSMVWAPNLLRAPEAEQLLPPMGNGNCVGEEKGGSKWSIANAGDHQLAGSANTTTSQSMIFEQTRQEMQLIKALITHLDTSFIANVH